MSRDVQPFRNGVYLGDAESSRDAIATSIELHAQKVGAKPAIVKTFFRLDDDFTSRGWPGQTIRTVQRAGLTNLIALDLRWSGAPANDLLHAIARGDADAQLRLLAAGLRDVRNEVLLEPGWEMNGSWGYPWQGIANGSDARAPQAFVRAWRHIVDVVRNEGARNVRFVFSPNVGNAVAAGGGTTHWNWYGHYYPGSSYVDIVGVHGFNGPSVWGGKHASFLQLFDSSELDKMLSDAAARFPDKPMLISEFASEEGPAKADWIADAYAAMKARPQIIGAIWFDMKKEADWRIDSSTASLASYRTAIGTTLFADR